ncbi:ABC transporter permease [Vineibacter terrae]|uniref:ABC transporter permease n=1 Tax=Vineibacter terrae TaxID=2586908 RepID=A0A5C8P7P9_9HYPH|nr:ABC transporter permease [Vineibacter terrae]TXL69405.1 ABC transporter permease [Vineibacter terrae]
MTGLRGVLFVGLPVAVILGFWLLARWEYRHGRDSHRQSFVARNGWPVVAFVVAAVGFWALVMIVLPQLYMVDFSFHPKLPPSQRGGPRDVYTLENYRYFLFGSTRSTASWNVTHITAFWLTIAVSMCITVLNFVICYPLAYFMAQVGTGSQVRKLMLLLIIPYWVNELLRAFAFNILFGTSGVLNVILLCTGVIASPIDFIGQDIALYSGLTYAYLLVMMFPLYNALESLDHNQIEAARDLGAPWWHVHLHVVMPFAKPGIASGCTLVFMLCAGALAAPLVLGGPKTLWFTPIVYDRFYQAFNWNQGAAYAIVLLLTCILFVMMVMRVFRVSLSEITR